MFIKWLVYSTCLINYCCYLKDSVLSSLKWIHGRIETVSVKCSAHMLLVIKIISCILDHSEQLSHYHSCTQWWVRASGPSRVPSLAIEFTGLRAECKAGALLKYYSEIQVGGQESLLNPEPWGLLRLLPQVLALSCPRVTGQRAGVPALEDDFYEGLCTHVRACTTPLTDSSSP